MGERSHYEIKKQICLPEEDLLIRATLLVCCMSRVVGRNKALASACDLPEIRDWMSGTRGTSAKQFGPDAKLLFCTRWLKPGSLFTIGWQATAIACD